jgi:two-component system, chemotaxis family, protein-glutamate methylesterase/glutaminase
MTPIRILVVDDSVVIRKLLSDTLSRDYALKVIVAASDGRIALAKISLPTPDLTTLDVEMPVMNGLETLAAVLPRAHFDLNNYAAMEPPTQ